MTSGDSGQAENGFFFFWKVGGLLCVREISMPEDMETIEIRETGGGGGGGGGGGEMEKPWRFPDGNNGGKLNFSTLFGGEGPRLFHHSFT